MGAEMQKKYAIAVEVRSKKVDVCHFYATLFCFGPSSLLRENHQNYTRTHRCVGRDPRIALHSQVGGVRKLVPVTSLYDKRRDYKPDDLIYYTKSPDYCLPDQSLGSIGTTHRWGVRARHDMPLRALTIPSSCVWLITSTDLWSRSNLTLSTKVSHGKLGKAESVFFQGVWEGHARVDGLPVHVLRARLHEPSDRDQTEMWL